MKVKRTVLWIVAGLVLAVTPSFSIAQGSHSQFAIAQPQPAFAPTQAPAIATRVPFANIPAGSAPIVIIQPQVFVPNPVFIPTQNFVPNHTAVVPNQVFAPTSMFPPTSVFAPTQSFIPNQFVLPSSASPSFQMPNQVLLPPTQLLVPGQTVIPMTMPTATPQPAIAPVQTFFGRPSVVPQQRLTAPVRGTSREDVLRQFGQPIVTVGTRTGETLYFSDGTKVTLENGQVTGSK
jgi:hypothetical protein